MRALLFGFAGVAALAGGFYLALTAANHPDELARLWNMGNSLSSPATTAPAPADAHAGDWTPKNIPAHPHWTWHMPGGPTYQDVVITSISGREVTITHSLGIAHLSLDALPPEVQRELQQKPETAPAPILTPVASLLDQKLIDAGGQAVPTPGAGIKYYAIYYSAGWCPPCHAFTPTLVDWYRKFKPDHHDFELIFVSEDKSESDMRGYMTEMQMPWPAVKYDALPRTDGTFHGPDIQQFIPASGGIPDLVLVDATGNVLADSYSGSTYVGPQSVVEYMNANLPAN
jgi:nucleoredoxin